LGTLVIQIASGGYETLVGAGHMGSYAVEPTTRLIRRSGRHLVLLAIGRWEEPRAATFPVHEFNE